MTDNKIDPIWGKKMGSCRESRLHITGNLIHAIALPAEETSDKDYWKKQENIYMKFKAICGGKAATIGWMVYHDIPVDDNRLCPKCLKKLGIRSQSI